jgi:hypothetical protein
MSTHAAVATPAEDPPPRPSPPAAGPGRAPRRRARLRSGARALAGLLLVAAPLVSPPLREALVALEPVVPPALFLAALVLWALDLARVGGRRRRRAEIAAGRVFAGWGWALAAVLFMMPVWAHWSMRPPGGVAAFAALFGHIPWSDVHAHYEGARRLLADGAFGPFSERRPLNASMLSVRLSLAALDLRWAIATQAALTGVAAWMMARVVGMRFGLAPSLGAFAVALGLSRDFLPTAATEPLGVTFACLALAILLMPGSRRHLGWALLGVFALDTALRARPGAQFLVPAVMVWVLWTFRRRWRLAVPGLLAVALVGSLSTSALNAFYGSGNATFTTYPAYTFYGLTRYSNWTQARLDHGAEIDRIGTEKEVARFLYARSFDNLRRDPWTFLRALRRNFTRFAGKLPANLARTTTLRPFFDGQPGPPDADEVPLDTRLGGPLLAIGALAFVPFLLRARASDRWFWAAALAGLLGSVPFVYGDAGFRGLAAAYPLIALVLTLGLSRGERREPAVPRQRRSVLAAGIMAAALLVVALAGPAIARVFAHRPPPDLLRAAAPGTAVVAPLDSARVVVTNVRRAPFERVPRIERREFMRMLEWASLEPEQHAHLQGRRTPFAVLSAYDHAARRLVLLVSPVEMLQEGRAFVSVETRTVPGSQFLDVVSWRRLDQPGAVPQGGGASEPEAEP